MPEFTISGFGVRETNEHEQIATIAKWVESGAPRGLLFPASIVQSGGAMYITNTALDFRHFYADERPITLFTLSRLRVNGSDQ